MDSHWYSISCVSASGVRNSCIATPAGAAKVIVDYAMTREVWSRSELAELVNRYDELFLNDLLSHQDIEDLRQRTGVRVTRVTNPDEIYISEGCEEAPEAEIVEDDDPGVYWVLSVPGSDVEPVTVKGSVAAEAIFHLSTQEGILNGASIDRISAVADALSDWRGQLMEGDLSDAALESIDAQSGVQVGRPEPRVYVAGPAVPVGRLTTEKSVVEYLEAQPVDSVVQASSGVWLRRASGWLSCSAGPLKGQSSAKLATQAPIVILYSPPTTQE